MSDHPLVAGRQHVNYHDRISADLAGFQSASSSGDLSVLVELRARMDKWSSRYQKFASRAQLKEFNEIDRVVDTRIEDLEQALQQAETGLD